MISTLDKKMLSAYTAGQLNNFFCDGTPVPPEELNKYMEESLSRVEYCFSKVNNKYFFNEGHSRFNHLHGDQYAMFLYFLSNTIYRKNGDSAICSKLFLLNKALHGLDAFYEVNLPDIFLLIHPLGTVLGRGNYSDYLLVYQRCGVGSNNNIYPTLGKYLSLHPGSSILGNTIIGENCRIAAESLVIDKTLESNTLYVGNPKQFYLHTNTNISQFWIK